MYIYILLLTRRQQTPALSILGIPFCLVTISRFSSCQLLNSISHIFFRPIGPRGSEVGSVERRDSYAAETSLPSRKGGCVEKEHYDLLNVYYYTKSRTAVLSH